MKSTLLFGLMTVVSADVCTDPSTTREQFIENLCCDRPCAPSSDGADLTANGLVCSASAECVSGDCRQKCCADGVTSGCDVCGAKAAVQPARRGLLYSNPLTPTQVSSKRWDQPSQAKTKEICLDMI